MPPTFASRMDRVRPSAIRELLIYGADPELIAFGGGYPDQSLFPIDELRGIYDELLRAEHADALQYTTSDGLPELRAAIAERLRADGTPATADDVLVVHGGQQGLDLVAKLMIDPGDTIVVEDPTFLGALVAFNPFQPRYATVRIDADGLDTDDLAGVLRAHPGASVLYTVPDFHNPTGVTLSLARRRRLIELANEHDLLVVEDSPYRELRFEGEHVPTLRSLDTEGRVVQIGTFSKILAPGMRLGWMVASPDVLARLGLLKLAADTQSSTLNMTAALRFLQRHDIDAHIDRVRAVYRGKRDTMLAAMDEHFPPGVTHTSPDGGLFTWVTFPGGFDAARFLREVAVPDAHVTYVPGEPFFAGESRSNHARFNFSNVSKADIVDGIRRLGERLTERTAPLVG
ncbi:PLP-dependent aminotransferase family protein [Galbitalea sp. SE-J8]|uniref:aminotransferase-like domain-containing protein n=1 Tax=Galbitalea sp. SE-J8 TaxID=3054952 RepID=UPI00259C6B3F|nr:PLP-dependent aminotransferase family protein [Galbitalea sp. SE-J8]MDM4763874.1 PLP-dependent aminotransferase family protein [Galbitalea sp. SE-J8]